MLYSNTTVLKSIVVQVFTYNKLMATTYLATHDMASHTKYPTVISYQRTLFCIQLQSYRLPLSCSHFESSMKEHYILFQLNSHTCDGYGQTFQSV